MGNGNGNTLFDAEAAENYDEPDFQGDGSGYADVSPEGDFDDQDDGESDDEEEE